MYSRGRLVFCWSTMKLLLVLSLLTGCTQATAKQECSEENRTRLREVTPNMTSMFYEVDVCVCDTSNTPNCLWTPLCTNQSLLASKDARDICREHDFPHGAALAIGFNSIDTSHCDDQDPARICCNATAQVICMCENSRIRPRNKTFLDNFTIEIGTALDVCEKGVWRPTAVTTCTGSGATTTTTLVLGAVTAILAITLVAVVTGWILTCVCMLPKKLSKPGKAPLEESTLNNPSYNAASGSSIKPMSTEFVPLDHNYEQVDPVSDHGYDVLQTSGVQKRPHPQATNAIPLIGAQECVSMEVGNYEVPISQANGGAKTHERTFGSD